jgi:hypothetical protein
MKELVEKRHPSNHPLCSVYKLDMCTLIDELDSLEPYIQLTECNSAILLTVTARLGQTLTEQAHCIVVC